MPIENPLQEQSAKFIASYFDSKSFSDIIIVSSDGEKIEAHRCILAGRSNVFNAMLTTDMLEKKTNEIVLSDIDGETLQELMRHIYKFEVQDLEKLAPKLLYCAEKYELSYLKQICALKLIDRLQPKTVFDSILLANLHNEKELMKECKDFINRCVALHKIIKPILKYILFFNYRHFELLKSSTEWLNINHELMIEIMEYIQQNPIKITKFLSFL